MAFSRMGLIVLMVSLALMAEAGDSSPMDVGMVAVDGHGLVADSLEVGDEEMMMESESARRLLAARGNNHIGYGALAPGRVPCNQRGNSYYSSCRGHQQANPYTRGCTRATRCARVNR